MLETDAEFNVSFNIQIPLAFNSYFYQFIFLLTGQCELTRLLVYSGFNPRQKDSFGQCPLHLASLSGDLMTVKLLCEQVLDCAVLYCEFIFHCDFLRLLRFQNGF